MKFENKFPSELDIEDLKVKGNIRKVYEDIPELAESFLKVGQLHAIGVDKDYTVIVGHRRLEAFKHLLNKKGIRLKVRVHLIQGDRTTLQGIENFHQSKMTPSEEEQCIESFIAKGMSQKEVGEHLCLTPQRVSDMRAAGRVRNKVEDLGIDTTDISSPALGAARSVDPEQLPEVIKKAKENGGTVKAVKKAVKDISKEASDFIFSEKETVNKDLADDVVIETPLDNELIKESIENKREDICYSLVKCLKSCKNNLDSYCELNTIEIDSSGLCGNFEEGN